MLDELNQRGPLRGVPEAARYSSMTAENHMHVMPS